MTRCVSEDLLTMQQEAYLCDMKISADCNNGEFAGHNCLNSIQLHSALFATRTSTLLPRRNSSTLVCDVYNTYLL